MYGSRPTKRFGRVILNWRLHRYVFVADISRMYRCIDIHEEDAQYQRIFWRDEKGLIKEYFLTTVTFGTASAPFTVMRVIHQIASDESLKRKSMWTTELQKFAMMSSQLCNPQAWSSRSGHPTIQISWRASQLQSSQKVGIFEIGNKDFIKALGLYWHPNKDGFGFNLKFSLNPIFTKRSILSTVARLFDPLGYLAPVILAAKILFKEVWSFRIERKDEPPQH